MQRLALVAGKGIDRMRVPHSVRPEAALRLRLVPVDLEPGRTTTDVVTHGVMTDESGDVVLDVTSVLVVRTHLIQVVMIASD